MYASHLSYSQNEKIAAQLAQENRNDGRKSSETHEVERKSIDWSLREREKAAQL